MYRFNDPRDMDRLGKKFNRANDACIARVSSAGNLMAIVWYSDHQPGASIRMHVESCEKSWFCRDFGWLMFAYAFEFLGVERCFGFTPEPNTSALSLAFRLGFKEVYRLAGVFKNAPVVITCIERSECKWLDWEPKTVSLGKKPS